MSVPQDIPELSIVFPCRNEELSLPACLQEAWQACQDKHIRAEIIVADNHSTDRSAALAQAAGARVVPVGQQGYGAALHAGILAARGEWVCFCDADGSYPSCYFPHMLELIKTSGADLLLANRLHGNILPKAMPFLNRYVGTPVLSALIRLLFRLPTYDCNSGMRMLRRDKYEELHLQTRDMSYASEMLCRAAQKKWKYREWILPLFRPDTRRGRPPHLQRWKDGARHLKTILACFFHPN